MGLALSFPTGQKSSSFHALLESYYDFNARLGVQFDGDLSKFTLFLAVLIANILTKVLVWGVGSDVSDDNKTIKSIFIWIIMFLIWIASNLIML